MPVALFSTLLAIMCAALVGISVFLAPSGINSRQNPLPQNPSTNRECAIHLTINARHVPSEMRARTTISPRVDRLTYDKRVGVGTPNILIPGVFLHGTLFLEQSTFWPWHPTISCVKVNSENFQSRSIQSCVIVLLFKLYAWSVGCFFIVAEFELR